MNSRELLFPIISYRPNPYPRNPPITAFQSIRSTHILPKDPRFPNISINQVRANRESHIRLRVITSRSFKESLVRDRSYDRWNVSPPHLPVKKKDENKRRKKSQNLEPYWDPCQLR